MADFAIAILAPPEKELVLVCWLRSRTLKEDCAAAGGAAVRSTFSNSSAVDFRLENATENLGMSAPVDEGGLVAYRT